MYFNILHLCLQVLATGKAESFPGDVTPGTIGPLMGARPAPPGGGYLFCQVVGPVGVELPHVMPPDDVFADLKVMGQVHG